MEEEKVNRFAVFTDSERALMAISMTANVMVVTAMEVDGKEKKGSSAQMLLDTIDLMDELMASMNMESVDPEIRGALESMIEMVKAHPETSA
jgi:hypothetical protein